jgi:hypothetical protein
MKKTIKSNTKKSLGKKSFVVPKDDLCFIFLDYRKRNYTYGFLFCFGFFASCFVFGALVFELNALQCKAGALPLEPHLQSILF